MTVNVNVIMNGDIDVTPNINPNLRISVNINIRVNINVRLHVNVHFRPLSVHHNGPKIMAPPLRAQSHNSFQADGIAPRIIVLKLKLDPLTILNTALPPRYTLVT